MDMGGVGGMNQQKGSYFQSLSGTHITNFRFCSSIMGGSRGGGGSQVV